MKLFNTKTQQIESIRPTGDETILCFSVPGPTETTQLRQAHLYCTIDVLIRYLEGMRGWPVKHAQVTAGVASKGADGRQRPKKQGIGRINGHLCSLNVRPPDYSSGSIADYMAMFAGDPGQTIVLCVESAQSPTGYGSAQAEAADQALPDHFRLQVATINHNEPTNSVGTLSDMLKYFSADAIRIYLAQHHYRSPWAYDEVGLEKAAQYAERLAAAMEAISTGEQPLNTTPGQNRFTAAMDNDLDCGKGIATLLNLADEILFRAPNGYFIDHAQTALRQMAAVYGLRIDKETPEDRVVSGWNKYQQ